MHHRRPGPQLPAHRSPLREKPLRAPGQSAEQQLRDLWNDKIIMYLLTPLVAAVFAAMEWWRAYHPAPAQPWVITAITAISAVVAVWKVRPLLKQAKAFALGRDGERVVGQELEDLRRKGCAVLHDIPSSRGNTDHAVISRSGVFAVETKTLSKPASRDGKVRFDGKRLEVAGVDHSADILVQAAAERDDLRRILKDMTGREFPVRSVIVFPGWYVETVGAWRDSGIWVMNPGMLPGFLDREPVVLKAEDVELVRSSLATYVRQHTSS